MKEIRKPPGLSLDEPGDFRQKRHDHDNTI